ncbi:putative BTB/POZ domain, NPH3 domain, NPH3/RPT2-like family protein [Helianthus annuus]|nr:putative BTB/POZ domain, NPH3 domain, NPH3/RPT2-like family protein [Helianthus annuus]
MASMLLGTKTDVSFQLDGHTWQCTSGLPGDVTIEIGETSFHLHKFPLISRSGLLTRLIGDFSNEDEHVCIVHLDEIPGGSKTFELIARFCYDIKMELTAHNVISLRCAADWLEMTDDFGGENLITVTENFLIDVFATWADTMKALESCEEVLHDAEQLFLVSRCITSLAKKACTGFNAAVNNSEKVPTSTVWNGISPTNKPVTTYDDWWHKDVSFLSLHLYKRVIRAVASRGMKPETIAGSLVDYLKRYIPLLNRELGFNDGSYYKTVSPSEADQRNLFEDIVELFPDRKGIIDTAFLVRLLRTGMILHVSPSCQENLEKRVGAQLDSAVLEDVLIPNQGFNTVETLYDIDLFQRMIEYFMCMHQPPSAVCSPCIVEEGLDEGSGAQSLEAMTSVANLVDMFLADVAADVNLKLPKFQSLAAAVPDYARQVSDGIYRAIDIYFKAHPWLADFEREQMCRLMNVQKLSQEASTHAARNERLPMRVIVQVIFFEQLRIRTSIAGWFYVSENEDEVVGSLEQGGVGDGNERAGMGEMRERVLELERDCETIKFEIRKLVKNKISWNFLCKRKTKWKFTLCFLNKQFCNVF